MYDSWDVVALVFFVLMLAIAVLAWLLRWIDAHNPMNHTRRCIDGRKQMATDWRRPQYLPEDWQ
jgi:hypothetical protein